MIQILLGFIPVIILFILLFIFKIKIKNWGKTIVNFLFWGFLVIYLALALGRLFGVLMPTLSAIGNMGKSFFYFLVFAGLVEEVSKFIVLKLSKPKTNKSILLNGLLIGMGFSTIENYAYFGNALTSKDMLFRTILPGHPFLMLFPIWGMILAKSDEKKKYYPYYGLLIGIIIHAIFDTMTKPTMVIILFAIIEWGGIIYSLYKLSKMNEEEEVEEKDKYLVLKIIAIVLAGGFYLFAFNTSNTIKKLNTVCHNYFDNIDIKVLSAESVEEKSLFGEETKKYIKVKVTIKNTSDEDYESSIMNVSLVNVSNGEKKAPSFDISLDKQLSDEVIKPNEELTGYYYFESDGKPEEYRFNYKQAIDISHKADKCVFDLK